jgi:hypothetical protein
VIVNPSAVAAAALLEEGRPDLAGRMDTMVGVACFMGGFTSLTCEADFRLVWRAMQLGNQAAGDLGDEDEFAITVDEAVAKARRAGWDRNWVRPE